MNAASDRDPPDRSDRPDRPDGDPPDRAEPGADHIQPLPGEAGIPDVAGPARQPMSRKGLLALALLGLTVVVVVAPSIARLVAGGRGGDGAQTKAAGDRPAAATTDPRRLDMTPAPPPRAPASASAAEEARIPALLPTAEEAAEPIGVRRTGQAAAPSGSKAVAPEDAPVMLLSARPGSAGGKAAPQRLPPGADDEPADTLPGDELGDTRHNLEAYQRRLQGLLDSFTRSTAAATGASPAAPIGVPPLGGSPAGAASPVGGGLFGGQLQGSATPRTSAGLLGNRSLTLPKGTAFTCALKTRVVSATSGFIGCQVQRNVYGDDGRVLLIERGSHLDGKYRAASVRPGTVRIPVVWTRIRTPHGVTMDIESPGTGALGESGIDGYVDNRWPERIGAAMLVSLINDAVQLVIQNQANDVQGETIILPSTTSSTSKLAEKVLESTINIPPLIYRNQGGIVGIYVARDVDFSSVYELKPVPR